MLRYAAARLLGAVPILLGATLIVFVLLDVAPGDPAETIAGSGASPERVAEIRGELGLDDPLLVRYGRYVSDAATGDLGTSLFSSTSVASVLGHRLPITLGFVLPALALSVVLALTLGVTAALHRGRLIDRAVATTSSLFLAVPGFVLAVILVGVFALQRTWFPAVGYAGPSDGVGEWLKHITLPVVTLAVGTAAELSRQIRGSMIDALDADYIRTARGKGLSGVSIIGKHAAKNAAIPVVTVLGLNVATLVGGAIFVEKVFAIPGMGALAVDAVFRQDIPVIQGVVVVSAAAVIVVNLLVDLSYGYFNPRLRDR